MIVSPWPVHRPRWEQWPQKNFKKNFGWQENFDVKEVKTENWNVIPKQLPSGLTG